MLTHLELSEAELLELDKQRFTHRQVTVQRRLHCVYAKAALGLRNEDIGLLMGVNVNSVGRYLRCYASEGLAGLCEVNFCGRRSELEDHAELLVSSFKEKPPKSLNEACQRIRELTGIERDPSRVEAFLKRHGFGYRKCGYLPGKADPEGQKQWLEEKLEPRLEEARQGQRVVLFMDAAHFVLGQFVCMMWCLERVFIRSGAGRNRINVLGALNAISLDISLCINTTYINAEVIMTFLAQIKQQYAQISITIVLDNARYQHCKAVKAVAQQLEIELLFLPAYSPNLNLIERLWKFAKKKILYGNYFDSPKKFHQAIRDFFQNISQHRGELKSLLTLNFQTFENYTILTP